MNQNKEHYKKNDVTFQAVVRNALNNWMTKEEQINVTAAGGVPLRLYHISPYYSNNFKQYKDKIQLPVVLSRGLWSNLYDWQDFGEELANDYARDTWLIEITGGPGQDCATCPNYDFNDLISNYYPTLINKVLSETGKPRLQYVGFSNGCRTALSSLENNYVDPAKVETFVGVGCPGNFSDPPPLAKEIAQDGDEIITKLLSKGKIHVSQDDIGNEISVSMGCATVYQLFLEGNNSISIQLFNEYKNFMKYDFEGQPGNNIFLSNFAIISGTNGLRQCILRSSVNDQVVSVLDSKQIYDSIIVGDIKSRFEIKETHNTLPNKYRVQTIIAKMINKIPLSILEHNFYLAEMKEG